MAIIIYIVMYVITFWMVFNHLSRPNIYRAITSALIAAVWPVPVGILMVMWIEALLESIRDVILNRDYE